MPSRLLSRSARLAILVATVALAAGCGGAPQGSGGGATATPSVTPVGGLRPGTVFVADNGYDEAVVWRDSAGHEVLVPPCSRAMADVFDGRSFTVTFASDGAKISATEPGETTIWMHGFVSYWEAGREGTLPTRDRDASVMYRNSLSSPWPCTGRNG